MDYVNLVVISLVLSTFEITTILILTFVLFRFKLKRYLVSMLLIGGFFSACSYVIREMLRLPIIIDTGFQIVGLFLSLRFIYRVGYFYSLAMVAKGVALYMILNYTISKMILFSLEISSSALQFHSYILQVLTVLIVLLFSSLVRRLNIGFSYVPFSHKEKVIFKGVNKQILYTGLIAIIICFSSLISIYYKSETTLLFSIIIMIILFIVIMRLSYAKEYDEIIGNTKKD